MLALSRPVRAVAIAIAAALSFSGAAASQDWRSLDAEQALVIDTTKGRIIVEIRPELAPKAVERIKLLARERVYDGLQFHRVIEGFVAQTGNPNNKDGGVSRHPDLEPEFTFRAPLRDFIPAAQRSDGEEGFVGAVPVWGERRADILRGWSAYCTGVAGMGRQADPKSANSEIFFTLTPERRLDRDYTVWGRIVVGAEVLGRLNRGEPPAAPDLMTRVRVLADLPASERPRVEVESGPALQRRIDAARTAKGADFTVCDVEPIARVAR